MIKICKLIKLTTCFVLFLIATGAFGQTNVLKITVSNGDAEITANTDFRVTVEAVDETSGTPDISLTPTVELTVSAGVLSSSSSASLSQPLSSGSSTWSDLKINALGVGITITVEDISGGGVTQLATVTSSPFNVVGNAAALISRVGGETASIAYGGSQAPSALTKVNTTSLFTFKILDALGVDGLPTTLTDISFDITNHGNLRALALFNDEDDTKIAELQVTGSTAAFTGLTIVASSGSSKDVNLRATFLASVVDKQQIGLTISSVAADASGSTFAATNGGGATTDLTNDASNAIAVEATTFAIVEPTDPVVVDTDFEITVTAVDDLGNTDLDANTDVTLSLTSGTGLSSVGGSLTATLSRGTFTWSDLRYNAAGNIMIAAAGGTLTAATSSTIAVGAAAVAVITATTFAIEVSDNVAKDTDFSLTVTAVDASGTPATDAAALTTAVTLSLASGATGALSPSGAGLTATLDAGTYTWENLQYDVAESIMITVAGGTLTEVTSDAINVFELLTTVFFSEYIEGGGFNKALEIYNGSGDDVDLRDFTIDKYSNAATEADTYSLKTDALLTNETSTLAAGDVYVIASNDTRTDMGIVSQADLRDNFLNFNGDDRIALLHNGMVVDWFGGDTRGAWDVAGMTDATENHTLVRKQSVTVGNAKAAKAIDDESSFGTTLDNSEWIVYAQDEFRYLGTHCNLPSTQASNVTFGTTDGTSMVVNWTKGDGNNSLVVVKAASEVDATPTWNNDYTGATAVFSDAVATLTTDNVVVYSGELATVTVTGLTPGETYHVAVYAYNADRFCYNTVSPAIASKATIVSDTDSDITRAVGGGETDNIDYSMYQAASNLLVGTSASLFTFQINDVGADGLKTILTEISFEITNHENLRVLALFDGTMRLAELEITSNTVAFTGLDIQALSAGNKDVNVRATFLESVDDGEQIGLTITSVTAAATGSSTFAADNGGGATTDLTNDASNAIVVTAVKLVLTEVPTATLKNVAFEVVVTAVDGKNNTDVADRVVTLSLATGTGALASAKGLASKSMTNGVYRWDDLVHPDEELITVTVTDNTATGALSAITSGNINIVTTLAVITVTVSASPLDFGTVNNSETSIDANVQNFMVSGTDLLADITVAAPENFEVSLEAAANFMPSVALVHSSGALTGGTGGTVTVYVRFAPSSGDNGPVTGDITLSTDGADDQTVSVMGTEAGNPAFTVTDTPLNDFGNVNNGANSASQMFTVSGENLTANITVTATDGFEVSLDNADFKALVITTADLTATNGVLASTPVHVRFSPTSGTSSDVTSEITLSTAGAENQTVEVTGTETAVAVSGPSFMVTEALTDFGTVNNTETSIDTDVQNFTVSGTGLTADITVAAPENFEVSLEAAANFMTTVALVQSGGVLTGGTVTVYVRFAPESGVNGPVTGDIELNTTGAVEQTVSVMGTEAGNADTPSITVTEALDDFGSVSNGETSESQSFDVVGANLTTDITVTAPPNFKVSLDDTAFTTTVALVHASGAVASTPVHVRFAPESDTTVGEVAGDIVLSATGATEQTISVVGTATAATLTGIGQESLKYNISVYPNPSEEVFHIAIPESFGTGEVKLVSLDGAVVQKGTIGKMKQIETSNLRSGIYLLQILNATTVVNYRVVVK